MTLKDRIAHMFLFELFALIIFIPLAMIVTQQGAATMTWLSIALTLIAMIWNLLYNWGYDALFGSDRMTRTFRTRIFHGAGFELGMILTSFPILMHVLQENFMTILLMDIGAVTYFFIYAIVFNWVYDIIRNHK